jgi:hypothetical protein
MRTDHQHPLKIRARKDPFGRRATLMRDIAQFEQRILFIPGQDNHMADARARSRIGWNVKWEERDEDTSKVAPTDGS